MVESFKELIHLFTDKSRSWGHKTAIFISIIGIVFLFDFCFNITYNLALNNKISQLETIQKLKIGYANDTIKLRKIEKIENQIINKTHYADYIQENLLENTVVKTISKSELDISKNPINKPITVKPTFSLFWMVLSSNYILLIVFVFLIFIPLYPNNKINSELLLGWFASLVSSLIVISIITWIAYKIPLILNNPNFNYILNFIIQTAFIVLIARMNKNKQN